MQADLFDSSADPVGLQSLQLEDGELYFSQNPALPLPPAELFSRLLQETPWRRESISLFGKTHWQPRLLAWYGEPQARYRYSGTVYEPLPWTPLLAQLRLCMQELCQVQFNSVLLNYYRDQHDSMGMHADDELELGPRPLIASLSLGAARTLIFKHKRRKELPPLRVALGGGSLLLMAGDTQRNWLHGINKQSRFCGPRINLTFRQIVRPWLGD